jgi:hypothetical protein
VQKMQHMCGLINECGSTRHQHHKKGSTRVFPHIAARRSSSNVTYASRPLRSTRTGCLPFSGSASRRRCAWRLAVDHHLLGLHLRSRGSNSSSRVLECAPHCALVSLAAIRGKLECCRYAVFCCAYELQNARDRCERREAAGHAWFLSGRSLLSVKHAQTTDLT